MPQKGLKRLCTLKAIVSCVSYSVFFSFSFGAQSLSTPFNCIQKLYKLKMVKKTEF